MVNKEINKITTRTLFSTTTATYILSYLLYHPDILQDDKYLLTVNDFQPSPLYTLIFGTVFNLTLTHSGSIIQPIDIINELITSENKDWFEKNNGLEVVQSLTREESGLTIDYFEQQYQRLKKLTILRDLMRNGFDISTIYSNDILNMSKLDDMSCADIINHVQSRIAEVEQKNLSKEICQSQDASKNLRKLINKYKEVPEVGLELDGSFYNYAVRGARRGKMYIYSSASGGGKTRTMVGEACAISLPRLDEQGNIIERAQREKVLFVATEMSADEIQTLITAYVSGVNERKILLGDYIGNEWELVQKAIDIIEMCKDYFIIDCIPDPSIALIKTKIIKYILHQGIYNIFYDYIFSSPGLLGEFRDLGVREDVALMMLSNSLKEIAMTYNVFIQSATQTNDKASMIEIGLRDVNCIRGSKAIGDKADVGCIGMRLAGKELDIANSLNTALINNSNEGYKILTPHNPIKPNLVIDIYKNRRGELNCIKIFRYFDYGTCRTQDLFITDPNYGVIGQQYEFNSIKMATHLISLNELQLFTEKNNINDAPTINYDNTQTDYLKQTLKKEEK